MSSETKHRRRRLVALLAIAGVAAAAGATAAGLTDPGGSADSSAPDARVELGSSDAAAPRAERPTRTERQPRAERSRRAERSSRAEQGERRERRRERIRWRKSVAVGTHSAGKLERGVLLPAGGRRWVSWDPILKRRPNREWRRWGTDRLVRTTLEVMGGFGRAHPNAPRVAIGDLSRPNGGDFGPQFGSIGHASHQNGLDVDVYYPRLDRRVRPPDGPGQVDRRLAQELVDRFVAAGAEKVFVGPSLDLRGPSDVVVPLVHHDSHLHARLPLD